MAKRTSRKGNVSNCNTITQDTSAFKEMVQLLEKKLLDKHHPTRAAKRSNNVGSSKLGTLNPTLFDSLARV